MEEAAFMKQSVVDKIVVPLMAMENMSLIAISTPDGADNYYSVLLSRQDDEGNQLFKTKTIGLVCDNCKAANRGSSCTHRKYLVPQFHGMANRRIQMAMSSNKEAFAAEQQGQVVGSKVIRTFNPVHLREAFDPNAVVDVVGRDGVVFLGIDPSGGSAGRSRLALVAWVLDPQGRIVVIGLEALNAVGMQDQNIIVNFVTLLRRDPRYKTAWLVCLIESNLTSNESAHYGDWIKTHAGNATLGHGKVWAVGKQKTPGAVEADAGLTTTNNTKRAAANLLYSYLSHRKFLFDRHLIGNTSEQSKKDLRAELEGTITEETPGRNGSTFTVSGKRSGGQDDIAMSLQFSMVYGLAVTRQPKYEQEVFLSKNYRASYAVVNPATSFVPVVRTVY